MVAANLTDKDSNLSSAARGTEVSLGPLSRTATARSRPRLTAGTYTITAAGFPNAKPRA